MSKISSLLNLLFDPAVIVDAKGRFIAVNGAFKKIMGLKQDQIIHKFFLDLPNIPDESKAILLENFKLRIQGVKVAPYEVCIIDGTGKKRFVEIKGKRIRIDGHFAVLVVLHDVTQRKENQQRLKEYATQMEKLVEEKVKEIRDSEELFRAISTCAVDAIVVVNLDGEVLYWNPAAEQIFGYRRNEVLGKNVLTRIVLPENSNPKASLIELVNVANVFQKKTVELTAIAKDGKEIPIELSVAPLKFRGATRIMAIARDISERKEMEKKLQEAEKRYRTLFNEAPLGILLIDETGRAVEFNQEAHRQLGYTRDEFAKLTVSDYEAIETPEETKARMKRILETGWERFESKHRTKTGEIRDIINNVQVIELDGKKFFHVITQDITELKRIEAELKMERDKLETVTENVGAGLAIIGRDYRILWANRLLKQIFGD